ncbi:MAG: hypothetical protein EXR83_03350 [Gammaproteobacteria bacterium]|nr:hypothetical protein [Gammaproteobacteria bacterium]
MASRREERLPAEPASAVLKRPDCLGVAAPETDWGLPMFQIADGMADPLDVIEPRCEDHGLPVAGYLAS